MVESLAQRILQRLQTVFKIPKHYPPISSSFKILITTIISQNTSDINTEKAIENLSKKFMIEPTVLADAPSAQIEECLKVAGLYKTKTKVIKYVSRVILEQYGGSLDTVLSLPLEKARESLLKLPGIGPKTADVVLLFAAGKPTIPVDTHVNRVSKRLGLVDPRADYEAVRASLQMLYDPKDYFYVHVLLIMHGRKWCKARSPLCDRCPISEFCQCALHCRRVTNE